LSINLINPYRFAGETEFDSMYESFNDLTTVNKQHMIEWFSGNALNTDRWNETVSLGGGSVAMNDLVNGGLAIKTGGGATDRYQIDFDDIRPFSPTGSVCIGVLKRVSSTMDTMMWLASSVTFNASSHILYADTSSGKKLIQVQGGGGSNATYSATDSNTDYTTVKFECLTSSVQASINGVMEVDTTSNSPTEKLQPVFMSKSNSVATVKEMNVSYCEAYNT
jgi:hypothetical protein